MKINSIFLKLYFNKKEIILYIILYIKQSQNFIKNTKFCSLISWIIYNEKLFEYFYELITKLANETEKQKHFCFFFHDFFQNK